MFNLEKGSIRLIVLVVALLGLIGGGYYFYQSRNSVAPMVVTVVEDGNVLEKIMGDPSSLIGELEDVSGGNAEGTAYLLRKNGVVYHHVEAKLPEPGVGLVYEGWLVNKTPSLKFFSTGVLEQTGGNFSLSYMMKGEYENYDFVVITLESEVDTVPEGHILEGTVR